MPALADPRLREFCALVQKGVEAWVKAGELLCAIKKDDPDAFPKLVKMQPGLSVETLRTFERLGRREIYPPLLTDGSMGAKRLLMLPYDEQVRLHRATIKVAVWKSGDVVVVERRLGDLSQREADVAFNCQTLRPISDQIRMVRIKGRAVGASPAPTSAGYAGHKAEPVVSAQCAEDDSTDGRLSEAQAALLRVRELLGDKTTVKLDSFITTALKNIGWLRFELHGGD